MKKLFTYCIISLIFIFGTIYTTVFSQNLIEKTNSINLQHSDEILNRINISKWKGGAKTSVNLSFDDNNHSHKTISLILDQYGFKGSFYAITGYMFIDDLKDILLRGHEVGNHTYRHLDLTKLDSLNLEIQINKGKEDIKKMLGDSCVSFAVPFHSNTPLIRKIGFEHHLFIRNVSQYPDTKRKRIDLGAATNIHYVDSILNDCVKSGTMFLITGHGIDGEGWDPISEGLLKQMLDTLKNRSDKGLVWVSTLKEVAQYENLVHEVQLDKQVSGDTLIIKIQGYMNEKYKNMNESPLTIEIPKSSNDSIRYLNKDQILAQKSTSDLVTVDLKKTTIIKAIYLDKLKTESINIASQDWSVFPNPASEYINISSGIPILKAEVYNLQGELMIIKKGNIQQLNTSELKSGIYVIKISTKNSSFTKKIKIIK